MSGALHSRRWGMLAMLAVMTIVATACGIDDDTVPRDISDANTSNAETQVSQPLVRGPGSDRVYLIAPGTSAETHHLRAAAREIGSTATQRLNSLFSPLSVAETSDRLSTSIPDGLRLHSTSLLSDGTLVVDVSNEILTLSSSALIDAVAQIVFTASELDVVRRVDLRVDGERQRWPAGNGELQTSALTVYDYPGFLESTQPDFPAVPSPEA